MCIKTRGEIAKKPIESGIFTGMSKPELQAENGSLKIENKVLKQELEYQKFIVSKLQKMLFGSTSERFTPEQLSNQMSLFNDLAGKGEQKTDEEEEKEVITYERNKPKKDKKTGGRIPLPEDLPRVKVVIEPDEDITGMIKIASQISSYLCIHDIRISFTQ